MKKEKKGSPPSLAPQQLHACYKVVEGSNEKDSVKSRRIRLDVFFYCVCVKTKTLCNCTCSSSGDSTSCVQNIQASHTRYFRPCHNLESHVCCDSIIPSENGFGHFKEQLKHQMRVFLRKKLFVILFSVV